MPTKNTFQAQTFLAECSWYKGSEKKRLFDGYRIFPSDPYAAQNVLIDKLHRDQFEVSDAQQLPPAEQIRLVEAALVHLVMMGAGEGLSRAELEKVKGAESIRHYNYVLSHFIRDFGKEWFKGEIPFTEADLKEHLRLLTFLNFEGQNEYSKCDVVHRHNQYPFRGLVTQVNRFLKKNKTHALDQALKDLQASLQWHAKERESAEAKLAGDMIKKLDAALKLVK
jgi:hypothetical protein